MVSLPRSLLPPAVPSLPPKGMGHGPVQAGSTQPGRSTARVCTRPCRPSPEGALCDPVSLRELQCFPSCVHLGSLTSQPLLRPAAHDHTQWGLMLARGMRPEPVATTNTKSRA